MNLFKIKITAGNLTDVYLGIGKPGAQVPGTEYSLPAQESDERLFMEQEIAGVQAQLTQLGYQTQAVEVDVAGSPV